MPKPTRADEVAYERAFYSPACDAVGFGEAYALLIANDDPTSRMAANVLGAVALYLQESCYRIERATP